MHSRLAGILVGLMLTTSAAGAQQPAADAVSGTMRRIARRTERIMVAAGESMPAEKWTFKPTPEVMSFAEIMAHVADDNNISCGGIAGSAAKPPATPKPTDSREQILAGLRATFAFCDSAMAKLKDSQLGQQASWYGQQVPMAAIVLGLSNDWGSHYSQAAVYLRLNGVLPPTAKKNG